MAPNAGLESRGCCQNYKSLTLRPTWTLGRRHRRTQGDRLKQLSLFTAAFAEAKEQLETPMIPRKRRASPSNARPEHMDKNNGEILHNSFDPRRK
ncbi:hypothetical protein OS493_039268 [Desmophyllum pertusum]|uniref:Uncharacterized protein n=1 Tax=Desmophyllum pertusum TaxID=174260 RepID=A0A9W9Z653_9CNID|nr:hypothetical protein OS493_039268 [Desmophyllum pertusum]